MFTIKFGEGVISPLRLDLNRELICALFSGTEFETYVNKLGIGKIKWPTQDYELLGQSMDGIGSDWKLGIGPYSIMVTSRLKSPKYLVPS